MGQLTAGLTVKKASCESESPKERCPFRHPRPPPPSPQIRILFPLLHCTGVNEEWTHFEITMVDEYLFITGSLESAYCLLQGHIVFWEQVEGSLWQFYDK